MPSAYFLGIKGVGMTALALAMQDSGWKISGADTGESFITDAILQERGIKVSSSIITPPPSDCNLVVYSGAYTPPDTKVKTLTLAEALAEFVNERRVIAIAGVGGKTTTSAMLSVLMRSVGRDVGYYIGTGSIKGLSAPGAAGKDSYYVIEADEYAISKDDTRPKFALLSPEILITTNIIHDHPDIYPDQDSTLTTFAELIRKLQPGTTWIHNPSDPLTAQLLDLHASSLKDIQLVPYGSGHPLFDKLKLSVFGEHNRLDALAAVLAAIEAGLTEGEALTAITNYHGAERRQERIGEVEGRLLYDDYGHHPEEIEATIKAFKDEYPARRLVVIFESHTYSRTEALFSEFAQALALADQVYVMPIFESAREKGVEHSATHSSLSDLIASHNTPSSALVWDSAAQVIVKESKKGDLLLTMGAGFVYKLHPEIARILES